LPVEEHVPTLQASVAVEQFGAGPAMQAPATQRSFAVHPLLSALHGWFSREFEFCMHWYESGPSGTHVPMLH